MTSPLTFLFMPESAYGPTNNSIGIAKLLLERGHRVVFAAEASWAGKLAPLGFEEDLVQLEPPAEDGVEVDAGKFWTDYINEMSPQFRRPLEDQLETVIVPIWQALIDGVKYCAPQLKAIVDRTQPDVIVVDNVVSFPAIITAGVPFVRVMSCNPLEKRGEGIAPVFSGLPETPSAAWDEFRAAYDRIHRPMWTEFNEWLQSQGTPPLPDLDFNHSGALNLYTYPEELDYTDARPLDDTWLRLDSSVRQTDVEPEIPAEFLALPGPLIYFSLGSLCSCDVDLMHSLIGAMADQPYRVIVSKGPRHEEIKLADNMWGAQFLPQTKILPLVDLVITHGGNNTTTEAMHFGKPMVLLPLFWDQYDNAQRVHEKGYGRRLAPYTFKPEELRAAINEQLGDATHVEKLRAVGEAIRSRSGLQRAADRLETLGRERTR